VRAKAPESSRRRAREIAFRVLYQADVTSDRASEVWRVLRAEERVSEDQARLVSDVVEHLEANAADVDAALSAAAEKWTLARLAVTDRSVLRAATAELVARPGTPARVVIDEAIEIAKRYGSDASGGFVNGVLDRVARSLRPGEL
jgi:transcription antitermination protein NusB